MTELNFIHLKHPQYFTVIINNQNNDDGSIIKVSFTERLYS